MTTEGIVLNLHPLTDSSLIVTWLTRDRGRMKTVAKAARRPTSPFAGQLDLFYIATLTYAESKRSELHTLRELKLIRQPERLRKDYNGLKAASSLAEYLGKALEPEFPDPPLYEMCKSYLETLESGDANERQKLRKEIWKHLK
jgi:DNA repair protein RecO (recombination protein O)